MAKKNVYLVPTFRREIKGYLMVTLPKDLETYMGEPTTQIDPTRCRTWPSWELAHGGKVAKYASGCCNVAPTMR